MACPFPVVTSFTGYIHPVHVVPPVIVLLQPELVVMELAPLKFAPYVELGTVPVIMRLERYWLELEIRLPFLSEGFDSYADRTDMAFWRLCLAKSPEPDCREEPMFCDPVATESDWPRLL